MPSYDQPDPLSVNRQPCWTNRHGIVVDVNGSPVDPETCLVIYPYEPQANSDAAGITTPPLHADGSEAADTPPSRPVASGYSYDDSMNPELRVCVDCINDCQRKVLDGIYRTINECVATCASCQSVAYGEILHTLAYTGSTIDKAQRKVVSHLDTVANIADSYASLIPDPAWTRVLGQPENSNDYVLGQPPLPVPVKPPPDWTCVSTDPGEFAPPALNPNGCVWWGNCWYCPPDEPSPYPPIEPIPYPNPEPSPPYNPYPPVNPPSPGPVNPPPAGGPVNPPPCPPPIINVPPCPPFPPINFPPPPPPQQPPIIVVPPPVIPPCPGAPPAPGQPPITIIIPGQPPIVVPGQPPPPAVPPVPPPPSQPPVVPPPPVTPPEPPTEPPAEPKKCTPIVFSYDCKDKKTIDSGENLHYQLMLTQSSFPTAGIDSLT